MSSELLPVENISVKYFEAPIKGQQIEDQDKVREQGELVASNLIAVSSYEDLYGTCSDERERIGLLNNQATDFRFSVWGAQTIYGLGINELIGEAKGPTAKDRLVNTDKQLTDADLKRGAHIACAACNGIHTWLGNIANNPDRAARYAKLSLGESYSEEYAEITINNARKVHESKVYESFTEEVLKQVYGEEAGQAFEVLADVPHEALTVARIKRSLTVADVNAIYTDSRLGKGTFIFNDPYANTIESALTSGVDAVRKKRLAEHAREMIYIGVVDAVPNEVLYEFHIN